MVKFPFGFPVVAMVSHIPVKSRMAVNYVRFLYKFAKDFDRQFRDTGFLLFYSAGAAGQGDRRAKAIL